MPDTGHRSGFTVACIGLASAALCWLSLKMAGMRMASSGPPPGSLASIGSHPQAALSLHQGGVQALANLHLLQGVVVIAISLGLGKAARAGFRHLASARRQRAVPVPCVPRGARLFSEEGRHDY
ncbi:hypothetical protein [Actibacterium ureilyticum]|uniref:hypothetical protein n=1 Tax=Actibacterium ureilyticum TaxID=1590614 RepID=UPI001140C8E0|nr:hypothetical protein [Actibacterium ureilyticum]